MKIDTPSENTKNEGESYAHHEKARSGLPDVEVQGPNNLSAVFENPLAGIPREQLFQDVENFCRFNLMNDLETFKKGALISQAPETATSLPELSEVEREALIREHTHKWSQPWQLYFLTSKPIARMKLDEAGIY